MIVNTNHIAKNLITKGIITSFPMMKGIIFNYVIHVIPPKPTTRKHGGTGYYEDLERDIQKIGVENIDYIQVFVDWNKYKNYDKKIFGNLIKKNIQLLEISKKSDKKSIKVEFINLTE